MNEPRTHGYLRRESGILLHPTSLPGRYGVGDVGPEARRFVDLLQEAGQGLWQVLPLGPTGHGNSPYMARSAMAGNPLLISLDDLGAEGLLSAREVAEVPDFPHQHVDFDAVTRFKMARLRQAHRNFLAMASQEQQAELARFGAEHAYWLDDYALFMALQEERRGLAWIEWDGDLVHRQPAALERARAALSDAISFHQFTQYQFFRQWGALRQYANEHGIRIMGDLPIFVALDSVDVWARPELFYLDADRLPTLVAGTPPDAFSETGQYWGNPLYRWEVMAQEGYRWWIERLRATLAQVNLVRIDHFRGFEAYWEIPASHPTAEGGEWRQGPGAAFFRALQDALGELPVIAEDLGFITPEVLVLRRRFDFPGMKVLQFAFDSGPDNPYLPHNYERGYVVYTGTHDNDTTRGWYESLDDEPRHVVDCYAGSQGEEPHWDLIRLAMTSVADTAIVPLQDLLGLDSSGRMNTPGRPEGNWTWRFAWEQVPPLATARLRELTEITWRLAEDQQPAAESDTEASS